MTYTEEKKNQAYAAIFFLCWFGLLVFLVDGVLKFQTLVGYFGSYALVEAALLLLDSQGFQDSPPRHSRSMDISGIKFTKEQ